MELTEVQFGLVVFVVVLAVVKLLEKYSNGKNYKSLPGPWGFPIIGNIFQVGSKGYLTLTKLSKQYGNVFQLYMGAHRTVVISGLETIKKALLEDSATFAGRPQLWSFQFFGEQQFGFTTFNERFKLHRKIARHALYMFANNRDNPVEEMVQKEACQLASDLLVKSGEPQDPKTEGTIGQGAGSIIYAICFGSEVKLKDDEPFLDFITKMTRGGNRSGASLLADFIPLARPFVKHLVKRFAETSEGLHKILDQRKDEHKESYKDDVIRHSLDALIRSTKQHSQEEKDRLGLTDKHIVNTMDSFIGAGTATTSSFLAWMMLYMIKFPKIQQRIQDEIDRNIGRDTIPCMQHRASLPYTEAAIWEIFRYTVPLPFLIPHSTVNDTVLDGYFIKKDTLVLFNMWSMARDETLWANPDEFNPEHFLDDCGRFAKEKLEWILPFGAGKRRCLGEQLARIEVFIFITTLLQRCSFAAVPGEEVDIEPLTGLGNETHHFKVIVTPRLTVSD